MRHVKLPGLMTPAERMARAAASAGDIARRALTRKSGTVVVQNDDGTKTVIGEGAGVDDTGAPNGVAQWVGDTTPPGVPTGVSCSSSGGVLTVSWDGTLEGGVPADFAAVDVYASTGEGAELYLGALTEAGSLSTSGLEQGSTVEVSASARDAARDEDGNPAPNSSARCDPVTMVVSSTIDGEEAEQIRHDAAEAADKAEQAEQAAGDAAKVATNYISEGEDGLVVGNVAAGELGANTLIKPDGIDIRSGDGVLARFSDSEISLGEDSDQSTVYMCGRKGSLQHTLDAVEGSNRLIISSTPGGSYNAAAVMIVPDALADDGVTFKTGGRMQGVTIGSVVDVDMQYLHLLRSDESGMGGVLVEFNEIAGILEQLAELKAMLASWQTLANGFLSTWTDTATVSSVASRGYKDAVFDYAGVFSQMPAVIPILGTVGATNANYGSISLNVVNRTSSSCTVRVHNSGTGTVSPTIRVWAFGVKEA